MLPSCLVRIVAQTIQGRKLKNCNGENGAPGQRNLKHGAPQRPSGRRAVSPRHRKPEQRKE